MNGDKCGGIFDLRFVLRYNNILKNEREVGRNMKKRYRVFFIFTNDRPDRALSYKEICWGAGNVDGSDGRFFARYPRAAFMRIRRVDLRKSGKQADLSAEMKDLVRGRKRVDLPEGTDVARLLSYIERNAGENDIFFLVVKRGVGGSAFIYGKDVIPIDLATLDDAGPVLAASYRLAGRSFGGKTDDITHHFIYSDGYLESKRKKD